jgi:outer membrane usher protein
MATAAVCLTLLAGAAANCPAAQTWRKTAAETRDVARPRLDGNTAERRAELLAVRINGVDQAQDVVAVRLAADTLCVPVEALVAWHLSRPAAPLLRLDNRDTVSLDAIAGLRWRIDTASQTLVIDAPAAAFMRSEFEVVGQTRPAQSIASIGGFVNYDLNWQRDVRALGGPATDLAGGLVDVGAFSGAWGNGRSSGVFRHGAGITGFTRLETGWNIDLPQALASVRLGDAIGTAGAWGRSVRFGGIQWATNFAVQPGLISFPMPAVRGEANVPSIVDLYVNGTHQLQGNLPAGAFSLPDVPVITGSGQIKMVVRDLLGREQVIVSPYCVSPALLRAGLHDYAVEAGSVREDYGLQSNHYGRAFISATDRQGITDEFTRELRTELLNDQQTLGVSGVWLVKKRAIANLSVAASHSRSGSGWLAAAGIDHQARDWSGAVQLRSASRDFAQLGQPTARDSAGLLRNTRTQASANFATSFAGGGVGINALQQSTWQGDSYRSLSANYGRNVGVFGYLSLFVSRTGGSANSTRIGINLIQALGSQASASLSSYRQRDDGNTFGAGRDTDQQVLQLQGTAPVGPGFGYQVVAEAGKQQRISADLTVQTERNAFSAGAARNSQGDAYRAGVSGGLALMPEGVFASRRIEGSFAVVQVGDYAGVRVNRDNQFVARTDPRGRALVTGLRGFESNRISVEGADLPLDAQVDELQVSVLPGMGSGVSVRFPVRHSRAASLRLVMADGQPVPPGSAVHLGTDVRSFPVGLDGRTFLAGLAEHTAIRADWDGQHCSAELVLAPGADPVPELGTVLCR